MAIKLVNLSDLDDWTSYLDAGIPKNELIQLLEQYYPTIEREHFCILLLKSSGL